MQQDPMMQDPTMQMPPEEVEQESTVTCPNCGAALKLEMPEEQAPATEMPAPSLRDTLSQAMGGET